MSVHAPDDGPGVISCISVINGSLSGEKNGRLLALLVAFYAMKERERCYSFVLSWIPHETNTNRNIIRNSCSPIVRYTSLEDLPIIATLDKRDEDHRVLLITPVRLLLVTGQLVNNIDCFFSSSYPYPTK
jgi:hypothetical protein